MLVIADTSPINYLVSIEEVEILPQLYGTIVIPPEVRTELLAAEGRVRLWIADLPDWAEVRACDPRLRDDPRWRLLDIGERAALALAAGHQPSLLLIDERAGTEVARAEGFAVTGTLGVPFYPVFHVLRFGRGQSFR